MYIRWVDFPQNIQTSSLVLFATVYFLLEIDFVVLTVWEVAGFVAKQQFVHLLGVNFLSEWARLPRFALNQPLVCFCHLISPALI